MTHTTCCDQSANHWLQSKLLWRGWWAEYGNTACCTITPKTSKIQAKNIPWNMAKCHLGEVKDETLLASGPHHCLIV